MQGEQGKLSNAVLSPLDDELIEGGRVADHKQRDDVISVGACGSGRAVAREGARMGARMGVGGETKRKATVEASTEDKRRTRMPTENYAMDCLAYPLMKDFADAVVASPAVIAMNAIAGGGGSRGTTTAGGDGERKVPCVESDHCDARMTINSRSPLLVPSPCLQTPLLV